MLADTLVILLYILLMILVIAAIALCIKLICSLNKIDNLVENITKKAETLDGVFDVIDFTSNRLGVIGETVLSSVLSFVKKLFSKKSKEREEEDDE